MGFHTTIGAVFRQETRYLREWLEYHLMLGVEHFYLFNHDLPEYRRHSDTILQPYVNDRLVDNIPFDGVKNFQMQANSEIYDIARRDGVEWLGLLDLDEFVFPLREEDRSLPRILADYERDNIDGLSVNLRAFGDSLLAYSPMLQTEALVQCATSDHYSNWTSKHFLRPKRFPKHSDWSEARMVDDNYSPRLLKKELRRPVRLRINHYAIRSLWDWKFKVKRSQPDRGASPPLTADIFRKKLEKENRNELYDASMHRFVPELRRRLGLEVL